MWKVRHVLQIRRNLGLARDFVQVVQDVVHIVLV